MITRFNYVPVEPRDTSNDDIFYKWSYEKKIRVLNSQKDGSVGDYIEEPFWKKEKCSWKDFIESYDLGTVSEQVISHLTRGTPLVTAHTLPPADYTQLEKGAQIKREMAEKGITMDMLVQAVKDSLNEETSNVSKVKEEGESNV